MERNGIDRHCKKSGWRQQNKEDEVKVNKKKIWLEEN